MNGIKQQARSKPRDHETPSATGRGPTKVCLAAARGAGFRDSRPPNHHGLSVWSQRSASVRYEYEYRTCMTPRAAIPDAARPN